MDFITREKARKDIVELGLPEIVLVAFDGATLHYDLDIQFREPYPIFSLGPEGQAAYGTGWITPVWTGGGDYWIVAYHHAPERKGFFRFDIESGDEQKPVGMNWQQVLVAEFQFLWEMEWPDDRLREVAGWFGFDYIEQLIAELPQTNFSSEAREAWYRSFLERISD